MSSRDDERLIWLATQYVLGEFSEHESEAFELRLVEDLDACEAVATASRLHLALRTSFEIISVRPNATVLQPTRRSWLAVAAAVAVCFLAAIGISQALLPGGAKPTHFVDRQESVFDLVDADELDNELLDSPREVTVPRWLLAGVSIERFGFAEADADEVQDN